MRYRTICADLPGDLLEVHSQNAELRSALEDLVERQNDYPTDLTRDPEWSRAFDRARALL